MNHGGATETRSQARRRWLQRWTWLVLACLAGCYRPDDLGDAHAALVGRYEPSKLPDGGASFAMQPCMRAEIMDQGLPEQMPGKLDISFTEVVAPGVVGTHDSPEAGKVNSAAIWIEDPNGALVRTLDLWGYSPHSLRCLDLYYKRFLGGCTLDVMTQATHHAYETWSHPWDGKSLHGTVVPDGDYILFIDWQIDEEHFMDPVKIPFTKGRMPWMMQPPPMPPHMGLTITYTPG